MTLSQPIPAASPESWNHQSAYASLKANAKHYAGMENARMLIRQSRQIRYLRYVQIEHQKATEQHRDSEHADPEQMPQAPRDGEILVQAA